VKKLAVGLVAAFVVAGAGSALAARQDAGTREHPYRMRASAALPESKGWNLRVNKVVWNGTAIVRTANSLNKPPANGRQFVLINVTMRYTGKGQSTVFQAGSLNAMAKPPRAYSFKDTCGVVPNELNEYKKISAGASVTGNVCFSVRSADVSSLVLEYEPLFSATNRQVFFALR
jgi:hypothetical protein